MRTIYGICIEPPRVSYNQYGTVDDCTRGCYYKHILRLQQLLQLLFVLHILCVYSTCPSKAISRN